MPSQLYTTRNQFQSTCYNPKSMEEYNPIEGNSISGQQPRRVTKATMSPVLWGLLFVFLVTLSATVYLTYTVVRATTAESIGLGARFSLIAGG